MHQLKFILATQTRIPPKVKSIGYAILVLLMTNVSFLAAAEEPAPFCGIHSQDNIALEDIAPTLYSIVSGAPGEARNWDLFKSLFANNGTITPVFHEQDKPVIEQMSVASFIALNESLFNDIGFYESEVDSMIIEVGHMATIISLYESREAPGQPVYSTGINSFQLVNDGNRWCVISVTWDSDKGGHPIPSKLALD
ncbi:hypothetical protein [Glaciecola sp. 1036]|uniref:hypothetical protein n=1 Tax=Alteromonadaceae TaxID=72275 RepID=UPI003D02D8CD